MIKLISFDLQGTLSNSNFSDKFWLENLPQCYAKKYKISLRQAKLELGEKFKQYGKYDYRFYDDSYWSSLLGFDTFDELEKIGKSQIDINLLKYIKTLEIPCVILSTTTKVFIDYELGENKKVFAKVFSTLDDFNIAGKTIQSFLFLAKQMNVMPCEILHIGDNVEMDIKNAKQAGCNALLVKFGEEDIAYQIRKELEKKEII